LSGIVYAVISVVQGNGAKYVATNLARMEKRNFKNRRVLLVDFDFENPFLAHEFVKKDSTHGIDNLLPHIHPSGVSEEIFLENIIQTRMDVDVLRGTQFIDKIKQFTKHHIETILKTAREIYDSIYVVISPRATNAGTVYTLFNADQVLMVLRNNHSNYLRMDKAMKVVEQYIRTDNPILLIYNFQNSNSKVDVTEKLKEYLLDLKVAGILEYDDRSIDNVDLDKKDNMFNTKPLNVKTFTEIGKQLI
jgi:MinD-like ATPase involved in chromosome partitioning or flagellar assembly